MKPPSAFRVGGATILVAALLLTGCTSNTSKNADGSVTLTFLNSQNKGVYDDVITAFEKENPSIKVKIQSVPFDQLISQTQARLGSGDSSIDVLTVDPPRLPDMVDKGFLVDVSDDKSTMEEKISSVAIDSVTSVGKQWAYPVWTSDNFLLYNKEILEAAGIEAPGPTDADRWTWEQVLSAAQKALDSGAAQNGITFEQVDRYYQMQPILMSMGAGSGLSGEKNLTPDVNSSEWKEFGEWYKNLHASGLAPRGIDPAQTMDLFTSGALAFYLATPIRLFDLQDSDFNDKWGLAPSPYFAGGEIYTPTDSWAVGVSAFSENPDAAQKFAKFMALNPEGAALASANLNLPPVNKDVEAAYGELLASIAPDQASTISELLATDLENYAVHRPASIAYVEFETSMNKAFADIRNGGNVSEILEKAQDGLIRQIERRK